jgi:type I restriction enzyme S subunit
LGDGLHGTPTYSEDGEYYFINGNNLHHGVITTSATTKKVSFEEFKKHKKELNKSTMLVSINGTIGKVAFYNEEKIILGKSACYFNVNESLINKTYLFHLIENPYFIKYANSTATGSTIQNVSLKSMRNFPIPMPPLALQEKYSKHIDSIEIIKNIAKKALIKQKQLLFSIQNQAFTTGFNA